MHTLIARKICSALEESTILPSGIHHLPSALQPQIPSLAQPARPYSANSENRLFPSLTLPRQNGSLTTKAISQDGDDCLTKTAVFQQRKHFVAKVDRTTGIDLGEAHSRTFISLTDEAGVTAQTTIPPKLELHPF